jgi:hypothetical protein
LLIFLGIFFIFNGLWQTNVCFSVRNGYVETRVARFSSVKTGEIWGKPYHIPNNYKIYRLAVKYVYQNVLFQGVPKYTKTQIFGIKIYHPATLV